MDCRRRRREKKGGVFGGSANRAPTSLVGVFPLFFLQSHICLSDYSVP